MTDREYMARALELARRGLMTTHPNPRVGCVLVKDGSLIAEGWHEVAGGPHAEIMALEAAGTAAKGATAYITLEPCSHHGRTPPCADALAAAGVVRVVAAMRDPNPQVAGSGLARLKDAGITTESGLMQAEAEALNRGFIKRMQLGRPWVTVKLAMSLDGRTAAADGSSQWITGEEARHDVHRLRAEAGAVLTGIGTVLADDPQLNVRLAGHTSPPHRIVLDSRLRMPPGARMLALPGRTTVLAAVENTDTSAALNQAGAEVVSLAGNDGKIDLAAALDWLGGQAVNEVLVEAGAELAGAFLEQDLADELICYVAPRLLGDAGRGLLHLPGVANIEQALNLKITDMQAIGDDWRITAAIV